ncbi:MAG TPA: COR domain-containing protein [Ignavibacteriaceae bacterium]|nr:COR domain-containing protein [Ignavibacteriaceae bacterium]
MSKYKDVVDHFIQKVKKEGYVSLDLSGYELTELSKDIIECQTIISLEVKYNKIKKIPIELFELKNLRILDLSYNNIEQIPEEIENLTELEYLSISHNSLNELPLGLFKLTKLKKIDVSNNNISFLHNSVGNLTNLIELVLANNQLSNLPVGLRNLKGLQRFSFENNIVSPPIEIQRRGIFDKIEYLISIGEGETFNLYEAKLLIVGEGGVGKTSLMKKIIYEDYSLGDEFTTEGVDIKKWIYKRNKEDVFTVNIWDFGGQEIYHATHQFFLTKRSLYLFVWEARKDDNLLSFDYWLNVINLLSNKSPIIVVLNKIDIRIRMLDEESLKSKFPNIIAFHKVSVNSGMGIYDLKENIKLNLNSLEHIGVELPVAWGTIRKQLEKLDTNYISYYEYENICKSHGFNELESNNLSKYYHDLGIFLHFSDNPILRDIVFLNPEWATNAVYRVTDYKSVIQNYGHFKFEDLKNIWCDFPKDKYLHLLELMKRFELCFEVNSLFIIPELLRDHPLAYEWEDIDNLVFEYHYSFMPKGILTRFIVRNNDLIDNNIYWKNGVKLLRENTKAIIISDYFNRKIIIKIFGIRKNALLEVIRRDFDLIHKTLNSPFVEEKIPCKCDICMKSPTPHYFHFSTLMKYRSHNKKTIECHNSLEDVSVSKLLDGYLPPRNNDIINKRGIYMKIESINITNSSVNIADNIKNIKSNNKFDISEDILKLLENILTNLSNSDVKYLSDQIRNYDIIETKEEKNGIINNVQNFMTNHGLPIVHNLTSSFLFDILKIVLHP